MRIKYGDSVWLQRGSDHHAMNLRCVKASFLEWVGDNEARLYLEQDDDLAISEPKKAGEVGVWSESCVIGKVV